MTPEELCLFVFMLYQNYDWLVNNGLRAAARKVADKILSHPVNIRHYQDTLTSMPWTQLDAHYLTPNNKLIKLDEKILQKEIKEAVHLKFFEKEYFTRYFTNIKEIYHTGYAFPTWSIEFLRTHPELFKTVEVFYDDGGDPNEVDKLFREREPTNIAMDRFYDLEKLLELFGYSIGAYSLSKKSKLMPNIAVKCRTPVKIPSSGEIIEVWFINLIGAAFDSSQQPDYQYFCRNEVDNSSISHLLKTSCQNVNLEELKAFYYKVWLKAFEAVSRDSNFHILKVVGVGSKNFSPLLEEKDFMYLIQNPIIEKLKPLFPDVIVKNLEVITPKYLAKKVLRI